MSVEKKEWTVLFEHCHEETEKGPEGMYTIQGQSIEDYQSLINAEYVNFLEESLRKIARGCSMSKRGCTCLQNTAQIALGERLEATNE